MKNLTRTVVALIAGIVILLVCFSVKYKIGKNFALLDVDTNDPPVEPAHK
jgi:hypothetical protein